MGSGTLRTEPESGRRAVLATAIYSIGAVVSAAIGVPAIFYLFWPKVRRKQLGWIDAGSVSDLEAQKIKRTHLPA
jgi:hypothetical protein